MGEELFREPFRCRHYSVLSMNLEKQIGGFFKVILELVRVIRTLITLGSFM